MPHVLCFGATLNGIFGVVLNGFSFNFDCLLLEYRIPLGFCTDLVSWKLSTLRYRAFVVGSIEFPTYVVLTSAGEDSFASSFRTRANSFLAVLRWPAPRAPGSVRAAGTRASVRFPVPGRTSALSPPHLRAAAGVAQVLLGPREFPACLTLGGFFFKYSQMDIESSECFSCVC